MVFVVHLAILMQMIYGSLLYVYEFRNTSWSSESFVLTLSFSTVFTLLDIISTLLIIVADVKQDYLWAFAQFLGFIIANISFIVLIRKSIFKLKNLLYLGVIHNVLNISCLALSFKEDLHIDNNERGAIIIGIGILSWAACHLVTFIKNWELPFVLYIYFYVYANDVLIDSIYIPLLHLGFILSIYFCLLYVRDHLRAKHYSEVIPIFFSITIQICIILSLFLPFDMYWLSTMTMMINNTLEFSSVIYILGIACALIRLLFQMCIPNNPNYIPITILPNPIVKNNIDKLSVRKHKSKKIFISETTVKEVKYIWETNFQLYKGHHVKYEKEYNTTDVTSQIETILTEFSARLGFNNMLKSEFEIEVQKRIKNVVKLEKNISSRFSDITEYSLPSEGVIDYQRYDSEIQVKTILVTVVINRRFRRSKTEELLIPIKTDTLRRRIFTSYSDGSESTKDISGQPERPADLPDVLEVHDGTSD